ncbi:MAG: ATP synthase F1 subunit epsilon [Oscillospiraceae bacterium]|nr:ATP synthase F1 subunit epsilon [Oscillospiraceae bacterium]MCL2277784.1 ATP synthase F1 subunit epsilon [Oscillospiraceae bacterium]
MKLFNLKILTPERVFFDGEVEAVSADAPDGNVTILADHVPFIMPVVVGDIKIKKDGKWNESVNSEGFLEVRLDGVLIFVQSCLHPEEIDLSRAEASRRLELERLRQKQSMSEYKSSQIALARAVARLNLAKKSLN